jgi:hypothetical protein
MQRLVISLEELPEHSAVSPCLFNINGESLYESKKTGLLSFYYQVINGKTGYKPGNNILVTLNPAIFTKYNLILKSGTISFNNESLGLIGVAHLARVFTNKSTPNFR